MAFAPSNITILNQLDPKFTTTCLVAIASGPTIALGTPSKSADAATAATGAVVPMVDGDGTIAQNFTGIAKNDSSETASAAGTVTLWMPLPGIVYAAKAKDSTTADTASEVLALFRKRVVFDLTSSTWTVDVGATDALVNCVTIIGGDPNTATVWFTYKNGGTYLGQQATS